MGQSCGGGMRFVYSPRHDLANAVIAPSRVSWGIGFRPRSISGPKKRRSPDSLHAPPGGTPNFVFEEPRQEYGPVPSRRHRSGTICATRDDGASRACQHPASANNLIDEAATVPSRVVLEFGDAISGISRVSGQAARSIG